MQPKIRLFRALVVVLSCFSCTTAALASSPDAKASPSIAVVPVRCYSSPGDDPRPVIVLLHGASGYAKFARQYESHAETLVGEGFRVCAVRYYAPEDEAAMGGPDRAARQAHYERRFGAWLATINASIDQLASLGTTQPGRVGVLGFSQGAYLGVAAAGTNRHVKALVSFYGGVPSAVAKDIAQLPPVLILHGASDTVVPLTEARALAEFTKVRAPSFAVNIYPEREHGFDARLEDAAAVDAHRMAAAFFLRHVPAR